MTVCNGTCWSLQRLQGNGFKFGNGASQSIWGRVTILATQELIGVVMYDTLREILGKRWLGNNIIIIVTILIKLITIFIPANVDNKHITVLNSLNVR